MLLQENNHVCNEPVYICYLYLNQFKEFSLTDNLNAPSWSLSNDTKLSYSKAPAITRLRIFLSCRETNTYQTFFISPIYIFTVTLDS